VAHQLAGGIENLLTQCIIRPGGGQQLPDALVFVGVQVLSGPLAGAVQISGE
jgi:hypothetical protein